MAALHRPSTVQVLKACAWFGHVCRLEQPGRSGHCSRHQRAESTAVNQSETCHNMPYPSQDAFPSCQMPVREREQNPVQAADSTGFAAVVRAHQTHRNAKNQLAGHLQAICQNTADCRRQPENTNQPANFAAESSIQTSPAPTGSPRKPRCSVVGFVDNEP